jgi:hypothetical protein
VQDECWGSPDICGPANVCHSLTHSNEVWNIFNIAEEQDYEKHSEKGTMQKLQNDVGIL